MMKVSVEAQEPSRAGAELLALAMTTVASGARLAPRVAAVDRAIGGQIADVAKSGDFRGRKGEALVLFGRGRGAPRRVLLLGVGDEDKLDAEALRQLAGRAVAAAAARRARSLAIVVPASKRVRSAEAARALAEAAVLASYRPNTWKTKKDDAPPALARVSLLVERESELRAARDAAALGATLAECQNVARQLSNEPANAMPPAALATAARKVAKETGLACRVLSVPELKKRKMGALLAVGQGSANPPRLIVLEHAPRRGRARPTVCVIGKGVTFDSGGISIKPSGGMQDMKHDMSGAAAVVGILRAAALLELPLHVVGIIAAAENMPSGDAYRPGDILTSMSGQTIEIQNTDAEGRLVLCDAIHFAKTQYEPDAIIDLATLTGACVVALGSWTSGLFSNNDRLADAIAHAGVATGERAWRMPMAEAHRDEMRSQIADLKNVSGGRDAGASTAAGFLWSFVGETPWAHLDIAGTAWTGKGGAYQPYGAPGVGVRLVTAVPQEWPRAGVV
jgi:leucyl aminopeptidase